MKKERWVTVLFIALYALLVGLGFACMLNAAFIVGLAGARHYPRLLPFSLIVGLFSLVGVGVTFVINYTRAEKLGYTKKRWTVQFLLAALFALPAFAGWLYLLELASKIF